MAQQNEKTKVRVAAIDVELGMSAQSKGGVWCKPTVRMSFQIDGGTTEELRNKIINQAVDELSRNIEGILEEL